MEQTLQPESTHARYARFPRRLLAMVLDGAILSLLFVVVAVGASTTGSQSVMRPALVFLVAAALLYDPILVSKTGGTLGHHWMNLKVVADDSTGNLPFGRALIRAVLKGLLGVLSFVFMAVSRRHQALHDAASHSTVQIRDLARAAPHHHTAERIDTEPVGVSRARRGVVITGYVAIAFVVMSILSAVVVTEGCLIADVCTPGDELSSSVLGFGWLAASAGFLFWGWRGKLPGARSR